MRESSSEKLWSHISHFTPCPVFAGCTRVSCSDSWKRQVLRFGPKSTTGMTAYRVFPHNVVTMETSAIGQSFCMRLKGKEMGKGKEKGKWEDKLWQKLKKYRTPSSQELNLGSSANMSDALPLSHTKLHFRFPFLLSFPFSFPVPSTLCQTSYLFAFSQLLQQSFDGNSFRHWSEHNQTVRDMRSACPIAADEADADVWRDW